MEEEDNYPNNHLGNGNTIVEVAKVIRNTIVEEAKVIRNFWKKILENVFRKYGMNPKDNGIP